MSGSSRVVLDSDDEDALDDELEISPAVEDRELTSPNSVSPAATAPDEISASAQSANLNALLEVAHSVLEDDGGALKRAATDVHDSARSRLKRPRVEPEPVVHHYVDDPYDGSQTVSQQQPTESQLQDVYCAVINAPSSTVMNSATPHPVDEEEATVEPADLQLGAGDITFHEDDSSGTPTKNYLTPMTSTTHQTSWNHNTMSKPVVMIPCPPRSDAVSGRSKQHRETSPDELSSEPLVGVPKEMYQPRPSRSRSLRLENDGRKSPDHDEPDARPRKRSRRASVGAMMQIHQESLEGMGFRASQAELALQVTGGNLDQAVDWLCVDKGDASENKQLKEESAEKWSREAKESTPDMALVPSQTIERDEEPELEPDPEPVTKKRKGAGKKKTPAKNKKKQQRSKAVAEDVEAHEEELPTHETESATDKLADNIDADDDREDKAPVQRSLRRTRGQDKKSEEYEQHEDELAETTISVQDEDDDGVQAKEVTPPMKSTRKGRGRPKKTAPPVAPLVEHEEKEEEDHGNIEAIEPVEPVEMDEGQENPVATVEVDADAAIQPIEDGHQDRQALAEKDANASVTKVETEPTKAASESTKATAKHSPWDGNLVRATPPLRLSNGPGHRVGLSRRRPIQSLLRTIKR